VGDGEGETETSSNIRGKIQSLTQQAIRVVPFEFVTGLPFDKCIYRLKGMRIVTGRSEVPVKVEYRVCDEGNYRICEFSLNEGHFGPEAVGRFVAYPGATSTHVEGQAFIRLSTQIGFVTLWGIGLILLPVAAYYLWQARNYGSAGAICVTSVILLPSFWFMNFSYQNTLLREIHMRLRVQPLEHD
jgi:hypothetical protein